MSGARNLLGPLLHGAEAERIFAPEQQLARMVAFELALAHAVESAGIAPAGTGESCARGAEGFPTPEQANAIAEGAVKSGNLAIPFVKLLTEAVRSNAGNAADFIHYGATSQDLLDTALVLGLRDFSDLAREKLERICAALVALTGQHRVTLMPGRTWLQQGPPVTFGLKTAQWLSAILRHLERLEAARDRCCVLQFGGAVGTLASLGHNGQAVTRELARQLALPVPEVPWHSQRDSLAEYATVLALIDGTLGKAARDLALMVQNEVAELQIEAGEGAGGSSTMPHKRNPVALAVALSAAGRAPGLAATMLSAMVQEHERGLGGWHAEWETLPELCLITGGSLEAMASTLEHLHVDAEAMRRNLDLLHGVALAEAVAMRLSEAIGRPAAHRLLEEASRGALERKINLLTALKEDETVTQTISHDELEKLLDPARYLGSTDIFIDQVLARAASALPKENVDAVR
jgi:3-carboxy-cis,cis-muconate cycloisomerase